MLVHCFFISLVFLFVVPARSYRSRCGNSCLLPRETNSINCRCDQRCYFYNDCCKDSPYRKMWVPRRRDLKCISPTETSDQALMLTDCSRKWRGPGIVRQKCRQQINTMRDPLMIAPVSSTLTRETYKNHFCAVCNDDWENMQTWSVELKCPSEALEQFGSTAVARRNIAYDLRKKQWGFYIWKKVIGETKFYGCNISFVIPDPLAAEVRACNTEEVASCSPLWTKSKEEKNCLKYRDPVFVGSTPYRNVYCAKCNGVPYYQLSCISETVGVPFAIPKAQIPNFGMLFNFEPKGEQIGRSERLRRKNGCKELEVYDEFSKKCRRTVCEIPGLAGMKC